MNTEADLVERLQDPIAVHLNMLSGGIAKPSWANIQHLYPDEFAKLRAERNAAARTLTFYADPFAWKAAHDPEDDLSVPDFYSETSFGDTAAEALSVIATQEKTP